MLLLCNSDQVLGVGVWPPHAQRSVKRRLVPGKRCLGRPFTLDVVRADTAYVREPKVLGSWSIKKQ